MVEVRMDILMKNMICKLCCNVITNNFKMINDDIGTILGVLLIKVNLEEENQHNVLCEDCCAKLIAAFDFKSTCLYTENQVVASINLEALQVDIKEIYLMEQRCKRLDKMADDKRICRLCLELIKDEFISIENVETEITKKYIPEMKFNYTKDPVVCLPCSNSLNVHGTFIKNCIDIQEKMNRPPKPLLTKTEQSHIEDQLENPQPSAIKLELDGEECNDSINIEENQLKSEEDYQESFQLSMDVDVDVQGKRAVKNEKYPFECYCGYKTKKKQNYRTHMHTHKNPKTVKCFVCDFVTDHINLLRIHKESHRDPNDPSMFKCCSCSYTSYKFTYLSKHMRTHVDASKAKWYKCDLCSFKSKYKENLKKHQTRSHKSDDGSSIVQSETAKE